jgi:hypothetical protein
VVHDAKLLRRQKSKDAKSVIPATFPVSAKTTKRAVSETVPSVVQPKKNKSSVGNAVINDIHDSRDEQIAELRLQVQLLTDAIKSNQPSVSSGLQAQQQNFGSVFVPPNTNFSSFPPQMFSTQTQQQQPQRSHYGTAGNVNNNEEVAMFTYLFQQQQSNQQAQVNQLQFQNFLLARRL